MGALSITTAAIRPTEGIFMIKITVSEAFSFVPPRRRAVLCIRRGDGGTDLVSTQWFTWLNITRQPMLSYSMERASLLGLDVKAGDEVFLAFPPEKDVLLYSSGVSKSSADTQKSEFPVALPVNCEVLFQCRIEHAYNYPFRKVRIFNCDLDASYASEALFS